MKFSGLFNGELHQLVPEEDFRPAKEIIVGWNVVDGENLSNLESPTQEPVLKTTGEPFDPRMPNAPVEQGWGALSVALGAFCRILEVSKEQFQRNTYGSGKTSGLVVSSEFTFQTKTEIGDRI